MPNMVKIGLGVRAGPIPSSSPHLGYPLFVCFLFCFVFFARRPEETPRPIATLNGSYDAVSAKEVPFGVSMPKNNV